MLTVIVKSLPNNPIFLILTWRYCVSIMASELPPQFFPRKSQTSALTIFPGLTFVTRRKVAAGSSSRTMLIWMPETGTAILMRWPDPEIAWRRKAMH